jgi:hypothetical protein
MPIKYLIRNTYDFHEWLFAQSARIVEFMNMCLMIGFTLPFLFNIQAILSIELYSKFGMLNTPLWWAGMLTLGIFQGFAMTSKGVHSNQISGFILLVSGWVWCMTASLFLAGSVLIHTAPIVYSIIAFTCVLSGLYLLRHNKEIEDRFIKGH